MKINIFIKLQQQTIKNAAALIKIKREEGGSSGMNFICTVNTEVSICSLIIDPSLVSTGPGRHQLLLVAGAFDDCQTIRLYSTEGQLTAF